jgi:hypothetical protein
MAAAGGQQSVAPASRQTLPEAQRLLPQSLYVRPRRSPINQEL